MSLRYLNQTIKWFYLFGWLFLLFPHLLWTESNISLAKQAETLFSEKLYGDAIPFYSQLFSLTQDKDLKTEWALRLANCHLEESESQIALDLLSSLNTSRYQNHIFFLMSLAYRQLGQSSQALDLLQQCIASQSKNTAHLIALEQGYHLMQLGDFTHAQKILESISVQTIDSYLLAQLQLVKIFLIKHDSHKALKTLTLLSSHLPPKHPLNTEMIYLKGWTLLAQQQEIQAITCFEELLPKALVSETNWSVKVLNVLITSYLRQAIKENHPDRLKILLNKADVLLQELISRETSEASYLLLIDFYLIKAKSLSDSQSYTQAQQLLNQSELFSSPEGLRIAALKRATAAPSYEKRNQLYEQLITQSDLPSSFYAKTWFLKGLNNLEEGFQHSKQLLKQAPDYFEQAIYAFKQVIQLGSHPNQIALASKYLAIAYLYLPSIQLAWQILDQFMANPILLSQLEHPEEIYCLAAWTALRLNDQEKLKKSKSFLQQAQTKSSFWQERYLKLEGMICMQLEDWLQADLIFNHLLQEDAYTSSHSEAWFWRAYCAEQQHQESLKKECFQQAYTQDPQSPYAPIAYFRFYSYRDYMQGKRKAIKHLQAMPVLFPNHTLLISAYYLIGLHYKKDYLSEEGKILRRKDFTTAIDAFQLAESTFDFLVEKNGISSDDLNYFTHIRYQSQLERAQANLAIAQSSTGGKRQIYLEYAEEVFKQLSQDFINPETFAKKILIQPQSLYPKIWAEAERQLAKVFEEKNDLQKADHILTLSLENYQNAQMVQGYGLMRTWYAKGKLAQKQILPKIALNAFLEAEKAVKELSILSPNEKLDLWIQQSLCYKELHQLKQSMRILSKVINDDVISPLRIKAMFLRAEIYELQGRPELAIKQLEATSHKGGEWALKAKEKLEKIYGY